MVFHEIASIKKRMHLQNLICPIWGQLLLLPHFCLLMRVVSLRRVEFVEFSSAGSS